MTRRHDSLVPLSHDHHHALAQARRLERAASMDDESDVTPRSVHRWWFVD
jgi:hypothetical protein